MEENKDKIQGLNIVMNGITINGPMFDIHDNGTVNNYFSTSTEEKHMNASEQKIKDVLLDLLEATDDEGKKIFTEKGQWYAVYKVLSDCHGYPKNMHEFCNIMQNWGMNEVTPSCDYESIRKIPSLVSFPTPKVTLWSNFKERAEAKFKKQLVVAMKLMELLPE